MKNNYSNFLIISVCVYILGGFSPLRVEKVTEDTQVLFKSSQAQNGETADFVRSFMRIAQSLVGLAMAIYLLVAIKRSYDAKGEGKGAIINWFSALFLWMVFSHIVIKLLDAKIIE
jgi:H+/Cl- antiporter ClcA